MASTKTIVDLEPCPFCFSQAAIFSVTGGGFRVRCINDDCGCSLPAWCAFENDEDVMEKIMLAAKYWNTRKPGGEFGRMDG